MILNSPVWSKGLFFPATLANTQDLLLSAVAVTAAVLY